MARFGLHVWQQTACGAKSTRAEGVVDALWGLPRDGPHGGIRMVKAEIGRSGMHGSLSHAKAGVGGRSGGFQPRSRAPMIKRAIPSFHPASWQKLRERWQFVDYPCTVGAPLAPEFPERGTPLFIKRFLLWAESQRGLHFGRARGRYLTQRGFSSCRHSCGRLRGCVLPRGCERARGQRG